MSGTIDTEKLLARASEGDSDAAGLLLTKYSGRLRRMIELRMDPRLRDRVDPSDILQDTCLEATRRLDEFLTTQDMPFHVWLRFLAGQRLVTMMRHHLGVQARDVRREIPMRAAMPGVTTATVADFFLASETSPTAAAVRSERKAEIEGALERLDGADRDVLVLRHIEGLSNVEAACELGLAAPAASKRYVRALGRLRQLLDGSDMSDGGGR